MLVGFQLLWNLMVGLTTAFAAFSPALTIFSGPPPAVGTSLAILYGVLYGVAGIIILLIYNSVIHLVATSIMGGDGTLVGLIRKTTLFLTALMPISVLVSVVPLFYTDPTNPSPLAGTLSLLFSLGTAVWLGKLTGDAYDFGTGRGCASIFVGWVLMIAVACGCIFVLSLALAQSFQPAGF
jgi:hypothetical protein